MYYYWKKKPVKRTEVSVSKKKKALSFLLISILISSIGFCCYNLSNRLGFLRFGVSGYSEWRNSNGQQYLYVEADNHYDLGYLTGKALSYKILTLNALIFLSTPSYGLTSERIIEIGEQYLDYIPAEYKEEMLGVSEGASAGCGFYISFYDILIQSVLFEILYGRHLPTTTSVSLDLGCTAIGTKNSNGSIILGQNMDLVNAMGLTQSFVLHKLGNDPLVFTHRLGGCLASPMGKNEHGLMLTVNLVQTNEVAPFITPTFVLVREGLANENSIEGLYNTLFPNSASSYSRNFLIANSDALLAVQSLPNNQQVTYLDSSVVFTNTYTVPQWQNSLADPEYSKERLSYTEGLVSAAYLDKDLTESELVNILGDEPIICRANGGLFETGTISFMTYSQFGIGKPNGNTGIVPI